MMYVILFVLVAAALLPFVAIYKKIVTGKKVKYAFILNAVSFFALCAMCVAMPMTAMAAPEAAAAAASASSSGAFIGAALATGLACIGAGIAVASAASAALGALSEDPTIMGKALIFVALAEGIALYGLLISIQILNKI